MAPDRRISIDLSSSDRLRPKRPGGLKLRLERFCYSPLGTFGHLYLPGLSLFTVERPWEGNRPFVSCIPVGRYPLLSTTFFRKGYRTVEIGSVPGRDRILVHVANVAEEVEGCVGVGRALGSLERTWAVTRSQEAFDLFRTTVEKAVGLNLAGLPDGRLLGEIDVHNLEDFGFDQVER